MQGLGKGRALSVFPADFGRNFVIIKFYAAGLAADAMREDEDEDEDNDEVDDEDEDNDENNDDDDEEEVEFMMKMMMRMRMMMMVMMMMRNMRMMRMRYDSLIPHVSISEGSAEEEQGHLCHGILQQYVGILARRLQQHGAKPLYHLPRSCIALNDYESPIDPNRIDFSHVIELDIRKTMRSSQEDHMKFSNHSNYRLLARQNNKKNVKRYLEHIKLLCLQAMMKTLDTKEQEGTEDAQSLSNIQSMASSCSLQSSLHLDKPPYRSVNHTIKAFETMNILRKQNLLCDVTLIAEGVDIPAHKMVLAACSPYFCAMFTSFTESKLDKITLQEIDPTALALLIDYIYSAEIQVTENNVQVLLPAANLLQLPDVRDACCDFLQSQLHPSNCLGIRAFADLHGCLDLLNQADTYAEQHFSEVVETEEYLSQTPQQICRLISSDRLTVPSEEKVCLLKHECRQECLAVLMEHVRLPLLAQEYLVQRVEEEMLLKSNINCKDYLIEAMKYHLLKPEQKAIYKTPRTKPRSPVGLPKVLLVIGGQAPKAIRSVECLELKDDKWTQLAEMPTRRCRAGVAVVNGKVFAVGGFNGSLRVRTVDMYDPTKDVWTSVANMQARRSTLGVAVLNDFIYAVGGFDGSSGLNGAECYNVKTNEWKMVAPMSTRRSSVGVGVVTGLLYAVGGYDGASRHCLSSVECYNHDADTWNPVADMSVRRSGAGVGVVDGLLYAVGGHDGPLVRKSVECYNPEKNTWITVADMVLCRRNAAVVAKNGLMYVVGGDDGSSNLASVEVYNPKNDTWVLLPSCMSIGRSYAGVAIVDKPM
ncbi:Ring canal kelch [Nymphon striatum]|nr:Ring canal kelch [Nymphon striatum]